VKEYDGEVNKDGGMKELLNITEDISADEEESELDQVEIKTEKSEVTIPLATADSDNITETEDIKVKIELSALDNEVSNIAEKKEEEGVENIVQAKIKSEVPLPIDSKTVFPAVKIEENNGNKDDTVEVSKPIKPKNEVTSPLAKEVSATNAGKEAQNMEDSKHNEVISPQVQPTPTDLIETGSNKNSSLENIPTAEKYKSKKKKDKEKLKSERVNDEIEEIERKLAKKKAKAAKLAEKERKKERKTESWPKSSTRGESKSKS